MATRSGKAGPLVFKHFVIVYSCLEKFLISLLILCAFAGSVKADELTDSLIFEHKRRQILENAPDERRTLVLGAAEDLARDGFFTEALELIYGMEDSTATAALEQDFLSDTAAALAPRGAAVRTFPLFATVQASSDYEDWEFQDQPWGARVKAKLEWIPPEGALNRVTSEIQASDHNAYLDLFQKASAFGRMLKLETEELVEKRFRQTYGDSLDRVYLDAWMEANTRPLGKPLSVSLPVRAVLEQYRYYRFGSLSSRRLWAQPRLEAVSDDLCKSLILSWEVQQTDYPTSPSTDNFSHGPVAWGEWYGDRVTVDAETRYQNYNYVRDTSLYSESELETRAAAFVRTWPWMKVGVRTLGQSEVGDYRDSVDLTNLNRVQAGYRLQGSKWSVQPELVFEWASAYSATLSVAYGRGSDPAVTEVDGGVLEVARFLYAPYIDWRPAVGLTILAKTIFVNLSVDYETNTVPASTPANIYGTGSSRGVGVNGNAFWKIAPLLEIDFTCMAERELSHGELPGRIQDMTSLSLGLTSRFP